jgi:hypothetical protein
METGWTGEAERCRKRKEARKKKIAWCKRKEKGWTDLEEEKKAYQRKGWAGAGDRKTWTNAEERKSWTGAEERKAGQR